MRSAFLAGAVALFGVAMAPQAAAEPPITTFTLDNGMDVVVIEDHRAPVATHMVWYRVGAADEPWGVSGIAHFLEHLLFKGTERFPEFSQTVAENGAQGNAFTSYDYTGYFQRVAVDRLGLMMALEADRMQNIVLEQSDIETEREVILEERNQRTENNPQSLFSEQLRAALWQNHPYGVPVIGWKHEMEELSLEDAIAFMDRYYAPDNAILVVAGDVTPDEVRTLAEEHYGPLEPSGNPADPRPAEPPHRAERRLEMTDPRVRQPYVIRTYRVPSYASGEAHEAAALAVLADVLGSGLSSALNQELQIEKRSAIGSGAWYSEFSRDETGFTVYGVPAEGVSLDQVEADIDAILTRIVDEGPDPERVERVQREAEASYIYAQDSQSSLARFYGAGLSVGLTVEELQAWRDHIASVTPEDVQEVARKYFVREQSVTGRLSGTDGEAAARTPALRNPNTKEQG